MDVLLELPTLKNIGDLFDSRLKLKVAEKRIDSQETNSATTSTSILFQDSRSETKRSREGTTRGGEEGGRARQTRSGGIVQTRSSTKGTFWGRS